LTGPVVFSGCVVVDMCAVYGTSNHSANVAGCVNGINNRTVTCQSGYHIMEEEHNHVVTPIPAPFLDSLMLVGYDAFHGCFPYCGDGVVTSGEACDDGNNVAGDGCYQCQIEAGWYCPVQGQGCCYAGDYYTFLTTSLNLVCVNGWWMSPNAVPSGGKRQSSSTSTIAEIDVSITITNFPDFVMTSDYLNLCGPVIITNQNVTIMEGAVLNIAGPLTVDDGGVLALSTDTNQTEPARIVMSAPCSGWSGIWADPNELMPAGFIVTPTGTIAVVQSTQIVQNQEEDMDKAGLSPLMEVYGCVSITGTFRYEGDSIPQENNYFPLTNSTVWENCLFEVDTYDVTYTLPSCPIVLLELQNQWVVVVTATHRMCAGAISGIVVGATAAVGAAAAAGVLLLGAPASAAATDYVML